MLTVAVEPSPVPGPSTEATPAPEPAPSPETTTTGTVAPDGSTVVVLHPQQFTSFGVALVLIVLLLAALLVAQLRRPQT